MLRESFLIAGISILIALSGQANAQVTEKQRVDEAMAQITSLLNTGRTDSTEIEVTDVVDVDSMIGDVNTYFGQLQDPYGTLKDSFIFTAEVPQVNSYMGEVGVFKEGQILWVSGPIIPESNGTIFATMDLTNSGSVDIITTWLGGLTGAIGSMWIFSWDGEKGVPINPYDEFGSDIVGNRGGFLIQDINGNGKYVITCQLDTADVEYAWNGTTFQTITNPPVLTNNTFSPANNFTMSMSSTVIPTHEGFEFLYTVRNMRTSAQSINNIMIASCLDSIRESAPKGWKCVAVKAASLARFVIEIGIENIVAPGMSVKGFEIISGCPPGISQYYAQAPHKVPSYEPEEFMAHLSEFTDDFLNNSVKGFTIAPAKPPIPFAPLAFLDTLISYKHQCVTLGWLRDDKSRERECEESMRDRNWYMKGEVGKMRSWEVKDSWDFDRDWNNGIIGTLDKRLEKVEQALTRGDSVGARRDLQIFVMEVELVNRLGEREEVRSQRSEVGSQKPVMTSEAYALLKYNAEYLIDRLPERHGRGDESEGRGKK